MRRIASVLALASAAALAAATSGAGAVAAPAAPSAPVPPPAERSFEVVEAVDDRGTPVRQWHVADGVVSSRLAVNGTQGAVAPRGSSTAYSFLARDLKGRPAHWNRCSVIRYRVNPTYLPAGGLTEIKTAIGELAAGSGITFSYAGATSVIPYRTDDWVSRIPSTQPAELYVAFSSASVVPVLAGATAGIGGPYYVTSSASTREPRIVKAGVTLDRNTSLKAGFGDGYYRGTVLLHELGHATNLGHTSEQYQTMHPKVTSVSRSAYQRGDLAGLAELATYACF